MPPHFKRSCVWSALVVLVRAECVYRYRGTPISITRGFLGTFVVVTVVVAVVVVLDSIKRQLYCLCYKCVVVDVVTADNALSAAARLSAISQVCVCRASA